MFDSGALCQVLFEDIGLPAGADFALAYSGGRDSHVLLHALCVARRQFGFSLTALHFDHGLDPQSADWARQCAAVCREWEVAFLSDRQPLVKEPGRSLEAVARQSRYRWFEQVVEPGQILLTAHHADDQAETVLLNLLRGGGVQSLAGIPRQRGLSAGKSTKVVRPLLAFPRKALAEYARRHQLAWIEDPSNQSVEFDRNYLRASVIPLLEQRWPGAIHALGSAAENCRATAGFLDEVMEPLLQRCEVAEKRGVFCLAPPLDAEALGQLRPPSRFQIMTLIRHWLHRHGQPSPSSGQLRTLFQQVFEDGSESASIAWSGSQLRFFNGHLYLTRQLDESPGDALPWNLRVRDLGKNGVHVEIRQTDGTSDGDLAPAKLHGKTLRWVWRTGGERMTLPGRKHSNALKKLFQQNAVPPWERRALPLLLADGEVAWAHGVGPSAACCAGDEGGEKRIRLRFVAAGD